MEGKITDLTAALADKVIYPIIALLVAAGLLVFIFGLVEFLLGLSTDIGDGKERGRKHMLYGIVGMFIMVAAYAILALIGSVMCNGSLANCGK
ncbi:MAG: hypothetical protein AAB964_02120 [Patescibacteria group bacterium]